MISKIHKNVITKQCDTISKIHKNVITKQCDTISKIKNVITKHINIKM